MPRTAAAVVATIVVALLAARALTARSTLKLSFAMHRLCTSTEHAPHHLACGSVRRATPTDRLHGTWANTLVTYAFDTTANTMTLTVSGTTETKPYTIVSQDATRGDRSGGRRQRAYDHHVR